MRAFEQYSKRGMSLSESTSKLLEHFDLHAFRADRVIGVGIVLTADRYGYRVCRSISDTALEDGIMPPHTMLSCVIDEMATWLRAMPIINHDPGDEDRR